MLVKEDSRDGLDNLCWRIAVGTRIVYHRKVRFGKREDDAVEFRNLPKRLAHLPADIVQIRLAKKVVFAIFVKKPSNILVHCLRHEALAMPEVDALARPVRDIHGLAQLAAIRLDGRNIYCRRRLRVWFVGKKTVEPAMRLVALATNLERINTTIFRRLFDDAPHICRLDDNRVHDRPCDFRTRRLAAQNLGQRRRTWPHLPVERLFVKRQLSPVVRLCAKDMALQLRWNPGKGIE